MRKWIDFYVATIADWHRCEIPDRDPDYISYSGSAYWKYNNRVRRLSDHWGMVSTCRWLLEGRIHSDLFVCGECYFEDFRTISFEVDYPFVFRREFSGVDSNSIAIV